MAKREYPLGGGRVAVVEEFGEESCVEILDAARGVVSVLCVPTPSVAILFDRNQEQFELYEEYHP